MRVFESTLLLTLAFWTVSHVVAGDETRLNDAAGQEFFEKQVRPLLVAHCQECHGDKQQKGGLRLDLRDGWSRGGDSGPAIVPGQPDDSLVIQAVRYGGDYEMPPKGRLPDAAIRVLEQWVAMGAPDPRVDTVTKSTRLADLATGRQHWAYQPVVQPDLPKVQNRTWSHTRIDQFILARLEHSQLTPAAPAEPEVLVRRLYFDLTGLPPTPEQIDAFVSDADPLAYERLVDRLLASPHFGERWGRHWLDVARFAESLTLRGFVMREAWRYRDYVIDSWNSDRPYDEFVREQIAGDLYPAETLAERQRQLIATTYLTLGNTNLEDQDKQQLEMDYVDEQLDVIGKGLLAQTITCARCHDHKFDPIPTRDYYALAGILRNVKALEHANVSKWVEMPLPLEPNRELQYRQHTDAVAELQAKIKIAKDMAKMIAGGGGLAEAIIAPDDLPGIVVDDTAAKRVGQWQESTFTHRYIGNGYLHDQAQGKGEKTLTFVPELPRDGRYEVRFAYTPSANRAQRVAVTVFSADGEKTVYVNEQEIPAIDERFVSLGQYRFERAGQSFVLVTNAESRGHVIADAVQFLPVETLAAVATTTSNATKNEETAPDATSIAKRIKRLETDLKKLNADAPYRPAAMTVVEQQPTSDAKINIRGNIHNLGETVPRGFLQVCSVAGIEPIPSSESGRRQLAAWLTSFENPLTARVIVNRIWHWLIGAGLVRTVDNFGTTGELPSHPELLDELAGQLVQNHWSMKSIVREIVLSSVYRQRSSGSSSINDPENRLLAHMNRRRQDAEALRDAILVVSGELRLEMGGRTFNSELASDYGFDQLGRRRSVYEPVFRNSLPEIFEAFDFADPSVVTGRRNVSTVAPQALFLMNHPLIHEQSQQAAQRLLSEGPSDLNDRITWAYRWTLGRVPTPAERIASIEFLQPSPSPTEPAESVLWSELFQSLFSTIDFRYLE